MEELLTYGARCTWFGLISETSQVPGTGGGGFGGLPCCPYCGGVLMQLDSEKQWWDGVDKYEAEGHPGYRAMWEWQREQKKCFRTTNDLKQAFAEAKP